MCVHVRYVSFLPTDESEEKVKVRRAAECCRQILNHVNQSVKESENKQVSSSIELPLSQQTAQGRQIL